MGLRCCRENRKKGFTLPEVLLAIGLISVALMAMIAHGTVLMKATQKVDNRSAASGVARSYLDGLAQGVLLDKPAGMRAKVRLQDKADVSFEVIKPKVGNTEYTVTSYISTVRHAGTGSKQPIGTPLTGDATKSTQLKNVRVLVTWWEPEDDGHGGTRLEYGNLEYSTSRLLKVSSP